MTDSQDPETQFKQALEKYTVGNLDSLLQEEKFLKTLSAKYALPEEQIKEILQEAKKGKEQEIENLRQLRIKTIQQKKKPKAENSEPEPAQ